jgi:hypothetical protein
MNAEMRNACELKYYFVIPTKEESKAHQLSDSSFVGMTKY